MRADLATALAGTLLAGEWSFDGLRESTALVVPGRPGWAWGLAGFVLAGWPAPPWDRPRELAAGLIAFDPGGPGGRRRPLARRAVPTSMAGRRWPVPVLDDLADVGGWLGLDDGALAWFADRRHFARRRATGPLAHYRVAHRVAASGGIRVLEAPRPRLRFLQRRLLGELLDAIPPHDAAHGFRRGRSVASYAAPHAGRPVVLRLDLESFFASVTAGRVFGLFRSAGYPEPVAHCLTGLVTTSLPAPAWAAVPRPAAPGLLAAHWRLGRRLAAPHLPQGAPTSPALANLAAYRLDVRLTALAAAWGGRYTRYADDLAFSGAAGWGRGTSRLLDAVGVVVRAEGFRLHDHKTAVLPRAGRQTLGGLVVNQRPHVGRREVDALRAVLHNCRVHGPSGQNRDGHPDFRAHLAGRVSWVARHDPSRGARLAAALAEIDWGR